MTEWDGLADWWAEEVDDPAYSHDVQPLVDALVSGLAGPSLDLGCGTGRIASTLPTPVFGCDLSPQLLQVAARGGLPVVRSHLPDLAAFRSGAFNLAIACLVLEHLPDVHTFFAETSRVIAEGGSLVVVANHPAYTSSGAGPVVDATDGEITWRWGTYFFESIAAEPAGDGSIVFHHRPLGTILNAAAESQWSLDRLIEAGVSDQTVERIPSLAGQEHMPRLLAVRWRRN